MDTTTTITITHPDNPQHVENLTSIALLKVQGFEGLISYYGAENVFGTSYWEGWEGFKIAE